MDAKFNSFLGCGVRLRKALLDNAAFSLLTKRVFPVVSKVNEKKPFVTYHRTGSGEGGVKDGNGPRESFFQFQVFSDNWEEGIDIAVALTNALHGYRDEAIRQCSFENASENFDFGSESYLQILTFKIKTTN